MTCHFRSLSDQLSPWNDLTRKPGDFTGRPSCFPKQHHYIVALALGELLDPTSCRDIRLSHGEPTFYELHKLELLP